MQIIPTILTIDLQEAEEKLKKYQGIFEWVQLDIMDGVFVDNKTLFPSQFAKLSNFSSFKLDIHLMVNNPLSFFDDCQNIGAKRIIGHIEMMPDQLEFIQKVKLVFPQVGLAIDSNTNVNKLNQNLLPKLDVILLMSVKAGWGGQKFSPLVLEKVKKLAKIKKEKKLKFKIALDGGINIETIKQPYKLGVEIFYIGNYLFSDPRDNLDKLKKTVYG